MPLDSRSPVMRRAILSAQRRCSSAAAPIQAGAQVTAFKQTVAESARESDAVAAFYRARKFEPIWTGAGDEHRARREALARGDRHGGSARAARGRYDADGADGR